MTDEASRGGEPGGGPANGNREPRIDSGMGRRWLFAAGYGAAIAVILLVTLWPSPVDRPISPELHRAIDTAQARGMPEQVDYGLVEWLANIALFLPLGVMIGLTLRRWWLLAGLAAAMALSVLVETLQALYLPERTSSALDVLANVIGVGVGVLIGAVIRGRFALITGKEQGTVGEGHFEARAVAAYRVGP